MPDAPQSRLSARSSSVPQRRLQEPRPGGLQTRLGWLSRSQSRRAFGSRYPWRTTILTALLFVLLFIQALLASLGGTPVLAGLHGINALILVGLGGFLTGRNWAFGRRAESATPTH